jgi:hypothetical protein
MADERDPPLLNPVLTLQMEPSPEARTGGGKGRASIVTSRLENQQRRLSADARALFAARGQLPTFGGRAHIVVKMFEDSLATSHAPDDLFGAFQGCQLVAPFRHAYIVETETAALPRLIAAIERPPTIAIQADISRVETAHAFAETERLRGRSISDLWDSAPEDDDARLFVVWLAPFRNQTAQSALLDRFNVFQTQQLIAPTYTSLRIALESDGDDEPRAVTTPRQSSIARAMRECRNTGIARATVRISDKHKLAHLVGSGVSIRIDPVRPITAAAPGQGADPTLPIDIRSAPIVAVIDGGLHARSYSSAEAWRAPPLVSDAQADRRHGNCVTSLVVHGHAWNSNRPLPKLNCRIGSVQAVTHKNSNRRFDERELMDYLRVVARAHPEAKVWNISANQEAQGFGPEEVSALGHELTLLARGMGILPVVSVGNVSPQNNTQPNPPADCEAAIVVGGRTANPTNGQPSDGCPNCLPGPGPDGMLVPDVSWFSTLRMLGGVVETGSSYATPLVSSLAAHTFERLRQPTPDMVKALLIHATERDSHDPRLGWGTPYHERVPWVCEPGTVTLAWRGELEPGTAYYWNDIPIPPELVREGRLFGRVRLTAVLRPLVSPFGGTNYFASRLETSLQYQDYSRQDWTSLVGPMLESTLPEQEARQELRKWQPVRRHSRDFSKGNGVTFSGDHLRVYARVYTRDLYQFGWSNHRQAGPQEASFVLTLWSGEKLASIYNSMTQRLGNFVESAIIDQDIEISNP